MRKIIQVVLKKVSVVIYCESISRLRTSANPSLALRGLFPQIYLKSSVLETVLICFFSSTVRPIHWLIAPGLFFTLLSVLPVLVICLGRH